MGHGRVGIKLDACPGVQGGGRSCHVVTSSTPALRQEHAWAAARAWTPMLHGAAQVAAVWSSSGPESGTRSACAAMRCWAQGRACSMGCRSARRSRAEHGSRIRDSAQGLDDIVAMRKDRGGAGAMETLVPGASRRGALYAGSSMAQLRAKVQPASEAFDPDVYLGLVHGVRLSTAALVPASQPWRIRLRAKRLCRVCVAELQGRQRCALCQPLLRLHRHSGPHPPRQQPGIATPAPPLRARPDPPRRRAGHQPGRAARGREQPAPGAQ